MSNLPLVNFNGKLLDKEHAHVPVLQSGVYYGTGCFETMLADEGHLFFFDEHCNRLAAGLRYLGVSDEAIPGIDLLRRECHAVLHANNLETKRAKLRIQVVFAETSGYTPDESPSVYRIIECNEAPVKKEQARLITARTRVVPQECRPAHLKLSNMLHYRQAFREASAAGADDALMLTIDGFVAETSIANIFWKIGDVVCTPSVQCDILPGIMRAALINVLNRSGIDVQQGSYKSPEILQADTVWLTNSVAEILPVASIDGTKLHPSTTFVNTLREGLGAIKESNRSS